MEEFFEIKVSERNALTSISRVYNILSKYYLLNSNNKKSSPVFVGEFLC